VEQPNKASILRINDGGSVLQRKQVWLDALPCKGIFVVALLILITALPGCYISSENRIPKPVDTTFTGSYVQVSFRGKSMTSKGCSWPGTTGTQTVEIDNPYSVVGSAKPTFTEIGVGDLWQVYGFTCSIPVNGAGIGTYKLWDYSPGMYGVVGNFMFKNNPAYYGIDILISTVTFVHYDTDYVSGSFSLRLIRISDGQTDSCTGNFKLFE
jgi:hypothetical protein